MNSGTNRLAVLAAFVLMQSAHAAVQWSNTPGGMFAYHGTAALCDLVAIYVTCTLLTGSLADDLNIMNVASIVANGVGWMAYMSYFAPVWYDTTVASLIVVSYIRLITGGGDAEHIGRDRWRWMVRLFGHHRNQSHQKEAAI